MPRITCIVIGLTVTLTALVLPTGLSSAEPGPMSGAIGPSGFLKTDGAVLKDRAGSGSTVTLRGTNLGGWLTQEDWMSPLGEFALERAGWVASASEGPAARAIDGSASTRWTTGSAQTGGEWLELDLGATTDFNRIELEAAEFPEDQPRTYVAQTSTDGATWASVAHARPAAGAVTVIRFDPQRSRYVRVRQTAAALQWWSVGEINLFNDPVLDNRGQTAVATVSAPGSAPALAVDNDVTTSWQTGAAQAPGQALTLDLGGVRDFRRILFDSGAAAPDDYPRKWEVFSSVDGTSWDKFASGYGTNRTVTVDPGWSRSARYVRMNQNGTSLEWWTVAEIALYSGPALDRSRWTTEASAGGSADSILDGSAASTWSTWTDQSPGQFVTVDFGARLTFNSVVLDTPKNTTYEDDWPRNYRVEVSKDGTDWATAAAGVGSRKATTINFPVTSGRHLRISQNGSASRWWSIGELNVSLNSDDYSLRTELDHRFGAATAATIADAHLDTWITADDLDRLDATGINFVRLPIGWNHLLNTDGTWKPSPWSRIDWLVEQASARGMYVLLDLHTVPGGGCPWGSCGRIGGNPNGFWTNATYQDWTNSIWRALAERYRGNPTVAGYDLINEPLVDIAEDADDVALKASVYDRLYETVRAVDPDHVIFLGAFPDWSNLPAPASMGWSNVVYQIHAYDMANAKDWAAQDRLVRDELTEVRAKTAELGVPAFYGEYSLYHYDDVWARLMAGLNSQSVSWSNWAYKVRGGADDGFEYWGMYYGNPSPIPVVNNDTPETFVSKLRRFDTSGFRRSEQLTSLVARYSGGRSTYSPTPIDRSGWAVKASSTEEGGSTGAAVDGSAATRWSTGQAQAPGQWLEVDLGTSRSIEMLSLETGTSDRWDFPRSYTIELSTDDSSWTPVARGMAFGWKRTIAIPSQQARYVRITQTGTAPEWWSIADLNLYSSY